MEKMLQFVFYLILCLTIMLVGFANINYKKYKKHSLFKYLLMLASTEQKTVIHGWAILLAGLLGLILLLNAILK